MDIATALCNDMGFSFAREWSNAQKWEIQSSMDIALTKVSCIAGNEITSFLSRCDYNTVVDGSCSHQDDISLVCNNCKSGCYKTR